MNMSVSLFLVVASLVAGGVGVGTGVHGATTMKGAKGALSSAQRRYDGSLRRLKTAESEAAENMDALGTLELETLDSFGEFSDLIAKIQERPAFAEYHTQDGAVVCEYEPQKWKEASLGASVLLGSVAGAGAGTVGALAAGGATTAAVMAVGTASTGAAISSLSGAAATNATLAALGGGSLAAGGGGMALGSAVLGASTLGIGLLVGGVIFSLTGKQFSKKAKEAEAQMREDAHKMDQICIYLDKLSEISAAYRKSIQDVQRVYQHCLAAMRDTIEVQKKTNWNLYTAKERQNINIAVGLVGLLFKMCQIELVTQSGTDDRPNSVNLQAANDNMKAAETQLAKLKSVSAVS